MRELKIDSIKGVLIFLVVFGHFLESMIGWGGDYSSTLLHLIYSFHMPFFILISGYFFSVNNFNKKLLGIFLVYIIYQTIYSIPSIIKGTLSYKYFYEPNWIMWFLMSTLFWMSITKFIKKHNFTSNYSFYYMLIIGINVPYRWTYTKLYENYCFLSIFYHRFIFKAEEYWC